MCQYYCDSSTPSVVSPAQAYFYPSSLSQKQQTQHWRRFQTVGLVLEKTFLLKHPHLSYLPAYIQHLQRKQAVFQPPVEEQEDLLFSVPWALVAVCSQVGVAEARLGLSQGSGDAVEGRDTSVCYLIYLRWPL